MERRCELSATPQLPTTISVPPGARFQIIVQEPNYLESAELGTGPVIIQVLCHADERSSEARDGNLLEL